jgi:hypothetical protein
MRLMVIENLLSRSFGLEVEQTSVERATNVPFWRWSQLIDATLYLERRDGVYADETKIWSRVQPGREDGAVGSLAAWGVIEGDWPGIW